MPWAWLLVAYFCFGITGGVIIIAARHSKHHTRKVLGVVIGVVLATIAAASLVFAFVIPLAGKETGVRKPLNGHTETIFLEDIGSPDDDKYYTIVNGEWVYSYLDSEGDVQIGHADAENCHEYNGSQDGKAFLLITTTNYEVEYKYLCFLFYDEDSVQEYDFYTP